MNNEPIQFLPVTPFWKKPVSAFRFSLSAFALGVIIGASGAVLFALAISHLLTVICQ